MICPAELAVVTDITLLGLCGVEPSELGETLPDITESQTGEHGLHLVTVPLLESQHLRCHPGRLFLDAHVRKHQHEVSIEIHLLTVRPQIFP